MCQRTILVALVMLITGCGPQAHRYSFEHRTDGIYRYDHVAGDVHVMFPNKTGWQKIETAASSDHSARN
jgi:hypothetical protein